MRSWIFAFAVMALTLLQTGCAVGFRAGGERGGVGAGAAVGPDRPEYLPPPP